MTLCAGLNEGLYLDLLMLDFIVVIFSSKMLGRHFQPDGYLLLFCRQFYYLGKKIVSKYVLNFRLEYGLKARPKEGFAPGHPSSL